MEWGRHDPMNHRRPQPQLGQPSASSTLGPVPEPGIAPVPGSAGGRPPAALEKEQNLLEGFRNVLAGEGRKATFTCAGRLPLVLHSGRDDTGDLTPRTDREVQEQRIVTECVRIRFGAESGGNILSLPMDGEPHEAEALDKLIQGCDQATFGRHGKDVLDETYRRAGAMGIGDFMTDFCPYKTGIIDIVTQLLLPSIVGDLTSGPQRSELAVQHDVTADQEHQIRYAVEYEICASNQSDMRSLRVSHLPSLLAILDVPLAGRAEFEEILQVFALQRTGSINFPDVFAVAAKRLHAKRLAGERTRGTQTLGPNELRRRMMFRGLRAELYKLNVYSGPHGLFKPHVDTPRSDMQIGSLVVCLPVPFEGGALAVRHQGQEVVHDWSAGMCADNKMVIQWAAFYSDCEHEVLKVTAGHRITLTYNLFLTPGTGLLAGKALSLQPSQLPLSQQMKVSCATPEFMPQGGYIGFMLTHGYPHTHKDLHHFVPNMLKGSDIVLYEAMHAVGLSSALEPIDSDSLPGHDALQHLERLHQANRRSWKNQHTEIGTHEANSRLAATEIEYEPDENSELCEEDVDMDSSEYEDVHEKTRNAPMKQRMRAREKIVWIGGGGQEELSKAYLAYGNQAELKVKYSKVALLVKVPSWAERGGSGAVASGTMGDPVSLE
ncbi:hypothetical protein LTR36_005113 [Oleoguttula mirabilis]|uniref:Fe2OG dioxygenase domain-containing protein n=1 Tax=Oleoguttula mirabilis TaxID=1507867 RepID=A0AAV9JXL2_9PEZI|nr:hypothetical protein LTR36_005113 [Oleoguttula mirabilis]